jgi:hypothetical protein
VELQGYLQSLRTTLSTILLRNSSDRELMEKLQSILDKAGDTAKQLKERQ